MFTYRCDTCMNCFDSENRAEACPYCGSRCITDITSQRGQNNSNNSSPTPQNHAPRQRSDMTNTSGGGDNCRVPESVRKRFNWGAFLLTWVWGIGNKSYITIISLVLAIIPILNFGFSIFCGIKGNEWAWRNRRFRSVDDFHRIQRGWIIPGLLIKAVMFILKVLFVLALILPSFTGGMEKGELRSGKRILTSHLTSAATMLTAYGKKCTDLSSKGLADYFASVMKPTKQEGNVFYTKGNAKWTFTGDNKCRNYGDCKVVIELTSSITKTKDTAEITLYAEDGYISPDRSDTEKYIYSSADE